MPGARDTLDYILHIGGVNYECSGNSELIASVKLEDLGLSSKFQSFLRKTPLGPIRYLSGSHGEQGSRSEIIGQTLSYASEKYGEDISDRAVYFGDRPGDVIAAKKAGIPIVFINPNIDFGSRYNRIITEYIEQNKCLHVSTLKDTKVKSFIDRLSVSTV
ncbi:HAD family hydrolase [archaeon]|jgi:phosphoglycolate phosphatase-like HAD superfamily hydrolase|nr:HAD family hydrolase [archaeon]MBT4272761.1 HAD family hydrolase [archaeon]MBT4461560.1 HAD family hydrolase [archaeon]MBT4857672.1 HAD family hydrolase [archaeon]MBT5423248.1 HAD family hydrolase [archaeon]